MVYLVEDDPDNAELVKDLLGDQFELRHFVDAAELMVALDGAAPVPQVFLLDLGLPRIDGYQLLRMLRQREGLERVPAIALTAHAMPEDAARVEEAGFEGYVTKPLIDDSVLVETIRRVRVAP